jgi:hypothetical protein
LNANTCVEVIGWDPIPGIPVEDYRDFTGLRMSPTELNFTLAYGNFPPGLHLAKKGITHVVRGTYGHQQKLERIETGG